MGSSTNGEVYNDLLILVDATFSMSHYLASLRQSLPQIISISALTNCFRRIGILAYRDYCDKKLIEFSGWMDPSEPKEGQPDLVDIASKLEAIGGGDTPEATKTGLYEAYKQMRDDATTIVLLYTDAPPHMWWDKEAGSNAEKERAALSASEGGEDFTDWAKMAHKLRNGQKKVQIFSILERSYFVSAFYEYLSTMTNGITLYLRGSQRANISLVTIEVLLAWMGVRKAGADSVALLADLSHYVSSEGILSIESEQHSSAARFFEFKGARFFDVVQVDVSTDDLQNHLIKKTTPLQDFAKTYKENVAYQKLVVKQLRDIIERDVSAISLNPVFGSLWRTFCNDRDNEHRPELLDLFGRKVDAIQNGDEKARMKTWLEESYDYTADVLEAIGKVPEDERFPCVCLDPTLAFVHPDKADEDEGTNRPITSFSRDELLEIGRSCDWRILKRLGRILTRLTYIESAAAMPAHIAAAPESEVTKIPMALSTAKYGRKFWRLLLHIVVPGTMLSSRPAALVAALSIRLGIQPMMDVAEQAMMFWRDKWNNIDIPETWNVNCLSLILDADKVYRKKRTQGAADCNSEGLLLDEDRLLFERLVEYRILESNLHTNLTARVGWTPNKISMPIGPVVVCKFCEYPRSVTIMAENGVCGLCKFPYDTSEYEKKAKSCRVTKSDNQTTNAVWYECIVQSCRAQYVVYNVEQLNVRPKCHYCRQQGAVSGMEQHLSSAPVVECSRCLSRMIWPLEYRREEDMMSWICIACTNERKTVIDVETTANNLRRENGQDWLLIDDTRKIKEPFGNRTLYHTASTAAPLEDFCDKVQILPRLAHSDSATMCISGKLIRNPTEMMHQLYSWISRRRTESGICSLCFGNIRKTDLRAACGRSGCPQRICTSCMQGWYGLNGAGRIINTAALCCPFCRRAPTAKTLARYGMGIHAVGGLKDAVDNAGAWIYAWCSDCGFAKEYLERVCAAGAPPDIQNWVCDECREVRQQTKGLPSVAKIKNCPGCGTPTEKLSGCDHIQCAVPDCDVHWCFFCGEEFAEDAIYSHMSTAHGGYYDGRDYDSDEYDSDEDV